MLLIILSFLSAVLLSVRFDMFILLPAILLGWLAAIIGGVATGGSFGSILIEMVLVAVALQVGYVGGVVGQWLMKAQPGVRHRWSEKSAAAADKPI